MNKNLGQVYNDAMMYYHQGNREERLGNYEASIEKYTKAIELVPDYENAYFNRGHSYNQLGNYEKSIEDFSKVIEQNSKLEILKQIERKSKCVMKYQLQLIGNISTMEKQPFILKTKDTTITIQKKT